MKVLYLLPDLFRASGGIARYARLVVRALSESPRVEQLDVLVLHDELGQVPDPAYWRPGHRYRPYGSDRLSFTRDVARRLLAERYDRVLSGHVNLSPLPYFLDPAGSQRRLVTFVYGIDAMARLPWYRRVPLRQSASVIAISQFTAQRTARANGLTTRKLRVLHNCLDPVFSNHRIAESGSGGLLPFGPNSLLTVSRLEPGDAYKGHRAVLRALPTVLRRVPDAHYYVVGEGRLLCDLKREAQALGVADHVSFLGRVSDTELAICYQMARAFAMPSKAEGFGFVFLEAMAYGCPVLAGNQDAASEVLGNGEAGVLVDPDDIPEIAAGLCRLLTDAGLRERLVSTGCARVKDLFGYPLFKSRLQSFLLSDFSRPGEVV